MFRSPCDDAPPSAGALDEVVWGAAAIVVERRWLILSAAQFVGFGLVTQWPQYHYEILAVVVAMGSISIAARSSRERNDDDVVSEKRASRAAR